MATTAQPSAGSRQTANGCKDRYDLLFLVDATYSMHSFIDGLNSSLPDILRISALTGSFERIGVMAYRDYQCKDITSWSGWCCPSGKVQGQDIVSQEQVLKRAAKLQTQGNYDTEEASKTGLAYAYQMMRPDATTLVLLYTDAPPHLKQVPDQNWETEQEALLKKESYGGTGHLFADWTSVAKTLKHGKKKGHVFSFIKTGGVEVLSPYSYLCEVTGGTMFHLNSIKPDIISRITTTMLLTWMGVDPRELQTTEGSSIEASVRKYKKVEKIELATSEDEQRLRRFMVTHKSAIYDGNMVKNTYTVNQLSEAFSLRGPPMASFKERYETDDEYKDLVVEQLRGIFETNVMAMSLNPVFRSLWRAVCGGRNGADRELLAPIFSYRIGLISNDRDKGKMKKWLDQSYDFSDGIEKEIAAVSAEDLYPVVFLDPTTDFADLKEDEDDDADASNKDDRPLSKFERSELLEIGRSCDGQVLRRLGKVLTRLTVVESADKLPRHIQDAKTGKLRVPFIPLALSKPEYRRRFWKLLLHTVLPGTMIAYRAAAVLAALSLRIGMEAFQSAADAELLAFGPRWNDKETPENWAPGCMQLILQADRDFETRVAAGITAKPNEGDCILKEDDRVIFRLLLDYKVLENHLRTPFDADVSWQPSKTQVRLGPVVICTKCEFPRSVTVMGADGMCGICWTGVSSCECSVCTSTETYESRRCNNVSKDDTEGTKACWVECRDKSCRAQYVVYNPKDLGVEPKCYYCRHKGNEVMGSVVGEAPFVECSQCFSRMIWPLEYRPATLDLETFKCPGCVGGVKTVVPAETSAFDLKEENGYDWVLRNDHQAIQHPFNGRSIYNLASTCDLSQFPADVELLPEISEAVCIGGRKIQNLSAIRDRMRERVHNRESAQGTCSLCFSDFRHEDLQSACGRPINNRAKCKQRICRDCSKSWYGSNKPGRILNMPAMCCPFCRRLASGRLARKHRLNEVGHMQQALDESDHFIFAWCRSCNFAKQYMERVCANGAPEQVRNFVCEDCRRPVVANGAGTGAGSYDNQPKVCPGCGTMTQRTSGCLHMTCHCGEHWCYGCGGAFAEDKIYPHLSQEHRGVYWEYYDTDEDEDDYWY